ncbi:predicted protein [Scheffersomyces stipitis CBS 6054]|uniref:Uncharacterized protein n=1 Tax=Scheffersomyces stipitis (strain ATCC 58785 / CBS 6054 / NBRC 10063 / NRRL Y-11545) TaxID=322104 RepID=A3LNY0_PICST|nr:predicted protein [Scheffersomyces stipitis CBS 6054]ABN64948.2 predicted protein [Scheffersomyces stipitis CBS 6054]KAG2736021.1 hypothetical protein G9P44_000111 [Scheffersomyces stipitis]
MGAKEFKQVDVFTSVKFKGNPLAVLFDADDLTSEQMSDIATWTNLSETTFILKPTEPTADYKVRIFTPVNELPFAGHPTLGTCFSLLESGRIKPKNGLIIQECKAGLVSIRVENYDENDLSNVFLSFTLPYYKFSPITEEAIAQTEVGLGLPAGAIAASTPPVLVDDGPKWAIFQLKDAQAVLDVQIDFTKIGVVSEANGWSGLGLFGKHEDGTYEMRNLIPAEGSTEDPACGSGAGAVGAYVGAFLKEEVKSLNIKQGIKVNRDAKLKVTLVTNAEGKLDVIVGGNVVSVFNGTY